MFWLGLQSALRALQAHHPKLPQTSVSQDSCDMSCRMRHGERKRACITCSDSNISSSVWAQDQDPETNNRTVASTSGHVPEKNSKKMESTWRRYMKLLRNSRFLVCTGQAFLTTLGTFMLYAQLPTYLNLDQGLSQVETGLLLSGMYATWQPACFFSCPRDGKTLHPSRTLYLLFADRICSLATATNSILG